MCLRSRSNWNLEILVFEERGKPEYPEKNLSEQGENQQQTQSTYDAGCEFNSSSKINRRHPKIAKVTRGLPTHTESLKKTSEYSTKSSEDDPLKTRE